MIEYMLRIEWVQTFDSTCKRRCRKFRHLQDCSECLYQTCDLRVQGTRDPVVFHRLTNIALDDKGDLEIYSVVHDRAECIPMIDVRRLTIEVELYPPAEFEIKERI